MDQSHEDKLYLIQIDRGLFDLVIQVRLIVRVPSCLSKGESELLALGPILSPSIEEVSGDI